MARVGHIYYYTDLQAAMERITRAIKAIIKTRQTMMSAMWEPGLLPEEALAPAAGVKEKKGQLVSQITATTNCYHGNSATWLPW